MRTRSRNKMSPFYVLLIALAMLAGCSDNPRSPPVVADPTPLATAHFKSTHNSYSGPIGGDRGSIANQLAQGVRCIEFDVHDDDFATFGYRIGHDEPGHEVFHADGNPAGNSLSDWLDLVSDWSASHPSHAPITLILDLKDPLCDNPTYDGGNLGRLNHELTRAFGADLVEVAEFEGAAVPVVGELEGKVVVVLSGSLDNRLGYVRDQGYSPAVAMNSSGHVIEVHDSGDGDLWYWSGRTLSGGLVEWLQHEKYDTGQEPAVALNDDGYVFEVHEDQSSDGGRLWYRMGKLDENFVIRWVSDGGTRFPGSDEGRNPTVAFVNLGGLAIREVHLSPNDSDRWHWDGVFNVDESRIDWGDHGENMYALYPKDIAVVGSTTIEVGNGPHGPFHDPQTLIFKAGSESWNRIQYQQKAFIEFIYGESNQDKLGEEIKFYAGDAGNTSHRIWAQNLRMKGHLVRLWQFDPAIHSATPPVTYPSTDNPIDQRYLDCCDFVE
jgi:hypothetical protein